jgi:lysozyme
MQTIEELNSKYSSNLVEFIMNWEGFQPKVQNCPGGFPTIGYGHKIRVNYIEEKLKTQFSRNAGIPKQQAKELLLRDIAEVDKYLNIYLKNVPLNPHQRDALISLLYNWGIGNFSKSKLREKLMNGEYEKASLEFLDINMSGNKVLRGLTERRKEERLLFLYGWEKLKNDKSK